MNRQQRSTKNSEIDELRLVVLAQSELIRNQQAVIVRQELEKQELHAIKERLRNAGIVEAEV